MRTDLIGLAIFKDSYLLLHYYSEAKTSVAISQATWTIKAWVKSEVELYSEYL